MRKLSLFLGIASIVTCLFFILAVAYSAVKYNRMIRELPGTVYNVQVGDTSKIFTSPADKFLVAQLPDGNFLIPRPMIPGCYQLHRFHTPQNFIDGFAEYIGVDCH